MFVPKEVSCSRIVRFFEDITSCIGQNRVGQQKSNSDISQITAGQNASSFKQDHIRNASETVQRETVKTPGTGT